LKNDKGSTPLDLATTMSGRGGSGVPEAKAQQAEIIRILTKQPGARGTARR
jgi:hypothetical protein